MYGKIRAKRELVTHIAALYVRAAWAADCLTGASPTALWLASGSGASKRRRPRSAAQPDLRALAVAKRASPKSTGVPHEGPVSFRSSWNRGRRDLVGAGSCAGGGRQHRPAGEGRQRQHAVHSRQRPEADGDSLFSDSEISLAQGVRLYKSIGRRRRPAYIDLSPTTRIATCPFASHR
jgi:hypothetical protein